MTITNIHELKDFLLSNELTQKDKCLLINKSLNVWINDESKVDEVISELEEFYYKYPNIKDRPLFLEIIQK